MTIQIEKIDAKKFIIGRPVIIEITPKNENDFPENIKGYVYKIDDKYIYINNPLGWEAKILLETIFSISDMVLYKNMKIDRENFPDSFLYYLLGRWSSFTINDVKKYHSSEISEEDFYEESN